MLHCLFVPVTLSSILFVRIYLASFVDMERFQKAEAQTGSNEVKSWSLMAGNLDGGKSLTVFSI